MKRNLRQFLSFLLAFAMILSMLPTAFAAEAETEAAPESVELTEADYAVTNSVWDEITELEDDLYAKKATEKTVVDQAMAIVETSSNYVEGSLERSGDGFRWMTDEGIACAYSTSIREKMRKADINPDYDPNAEVSVETISYENKGGSPGAKNVYLIGPYYGIDNSFTDQYKAEAQSIASALGGTYTLYQTTNATITNVANAMMNGAVIIFDSHGDTDYANGEDYTSGATTSYLCLQSGTGITTADYANNYHAVYWGSNGSMQYYGVDGTAIANHITGTCPNNLLWMAICLGMATDGIYAPLRAKGVEVVYGDSQSITFVGDYDYEEIFWDDMIAGDTVAEAIANMKSQVGIRDPYENNYPAYPIVVSSEDTYPGHGNVDKAQTVRSTYTLYSQYTVSATSNNTDYGTVSVSGNVITATPKTGYYVSGYTVTAGSATVSQSGNVFTVSASADCTVRINFAAKTAATVSYSVNCAAYSSASSYTGDTVSLPGAPSEIPDGYSFAGWTDAELAETTDEPTIYAAGSTYVVPGNVTLYAVFTRVEAGADPGNGEYTLVRDASQLSVGASVVIAAANADYAMSTNQASSNRTGTAVTKTGDTLSITASVA
ncbi:MAG: InlB B-repeat-containing protein, partial [Oscillospiraceae bacterium]|nr:InlB B-repeat-containing protein [Oscillospiraceae bacterium]